MDGKQETKITDNLSIASERLKENDRHYQILQQLEKILANSEFYASEQQKNFLQFVVQESLAGRSDQLKGYTVATQVFGRAEDFDPQIDPIVSVQANKLRRALEHYYLVDGQNDSIIIDIPKGTYVPVFIERHASGSDEKKSEGYSALDNFDNLPTLFILPFQNRTGDPDKNYLCIGLAAELATEISYFKNMRVLFPKEGVESNSGTVNLLEPRFRLTGDVYETAGEIKITTHLEDTKSRSHVWGDTYKGKLDASELTDYLENVVKIIASKISGDYGVISRLISAETRHVHTTQLSTYEAILRFYEYEYSNSPESSRRSFEALAAAVKNDPHCGRVWTLLGQQCAMIHNLAIPGVEEPLQKAIEYTERGALLEPHCQRAIGTLAFIRFSNNELTIAIDEVDRALSLNPDSLFVMDGLAYILILSGDWDRGIKFAQKAIKNNPYHRTALHDALWVNYLRLEKYNHAYHEAMHGRRPWLFWDPLIKSSTLGLLGQVKEGREYATKLIDVRPDFPTSGRKLIRNYIKFEEIAERIEKGLKQVGVELI